MALLEVQDIQVYYGMIQALKGVSFSVNEGEVIALIGANGAGKTTTLHTVTGLLRAKSGHIIYDGQDITKVPLSLTSLMISKISFTKIGERPMDGSSIRMIFGWLISARPMASICCSPPLKVPAV